MLERLNLNSLRGLDMTQVKSMGSTALKGLSQLSKKRVSIAGYSVNPMLLGGAAALALGGYLISRRGRQTAQVAGSTGMQQQARPVK